MSVNLIKQLKTWHGKLNCYAVDTFEDLDKLSENELEIIGCRAYCIFNGKFYIMGSDKKWKETITVFNEVLKKTVTRRGVYSWTFDPNIHDGIQEIEVEFIPTLQEFEETITRTGDYTFRYNKNDYDGFDDFTVHFIPTLQEIEEEITRAGDYEYEFNPEDYDGIKKITVHVKPTLQEIEKEIDEGGEYEFTFDPENYDGIGKLTLDVQVSGTSLNLYSWQAGGHVVFTSLEKPTAASHLYSNVSDRGVDYFRDVTSESFKIVEVLDGSIRIGSDIYTWAPYSDTEDDMVIPGCKGYFYAWSSGNKLLYTVKTNPSKTTKIYGIGFDGHKTIFLNLTKPDYKISEVNENYIMVGDVKFDRSEEDDVHILDEDLGTGTLVIVDEDDNTPGTLSEKLVSAEGSGIELNVVGDDENKKLEIKFSMNDFEIEFLETMPFASMQQSMNPLYSSQSATLIASSVIPNYSFSFRQDESKFICYSDTGDMTNCRLVALKLNSDNSATVIAYSEQFRASTIRNGAKIEATCEWSNGEKIKAGERYYLGIVGRLVDTSWLKMFGYQSWASQSTTMNPPFNIYSNYNILASPDNQNIPANQIFENSANTIYIGVTH